MKNKRNINRFDPFMPIKFSSIQKNNFSENQNTVTESENFASRTFDFVAIDDKFKFDLPSVKKGFVVLLSKKEIGDKNSLGEKLMEDFVFTLSEAIELPEYVIMMNEAIYLLDNKNVNDNILKMKKYGVSFLASLESIEYFNYKFNVKGIKQATSADITEKIMFSEKFINM